MENKPLVKMAVQDIARLEELLIEHDGEVTEEIESALAIKEVHFPHKVDSYGFILDRFDALSSFYNEKAEFYLRMSRAAKTVVDQCKLNLRIAMNALHTDELTGNDIKFKLQRSNPSVVVDDEALIENIYKKEKIEVLIDKKKIGEDLKLGVPVPGAHLEESYSLRKYANTPTRRKASTQ